MKDLEEIKDKMLTARQLIAYFWRSPQWWLTPYLTILMLLGLLIALATGKTHSRFIYTLS